MAMLRDMTLSDADRLDGAADEACAFHMNDAAFRVFYDRTARSLWAYLYRLTGDGTRADDLLQETYYRFLRAVDAPHDEAHRRNYLYRIATNLVRDEARRTRGTQVELPGSDDEDALVAVGHSADDAARRTDVGNAMRKLTPRERELLWLAYAEGSTHREIAEALGLKAGSIKLLLFRARRRLAGLLRRGVPSSGEGGA